MNIDRLKSELWEDEGVVKSGGRHVAYQDHLGYWTIGCGNLIDARKGGGLTDEEADYLLENKIASILVQLRKRLPFWNQLDDTRQRALMNMAFQMGVEGLMKFKNMLWAIERGQWGLAHAEALDSSWANQTPARAKRVAGMILHGC